MVRRLAALIFSAAPAMAQQVEDCDWRASAWLLAEPWEQHSRTFANGDVRVALIDAIEPAAGAFHLLVLSPPWDVLGARQCRVLSLGPGIGFAGVDFAALEAWYDPSAGLFFSVPVSVYEAATGGFGERIFDFTVNQATGAIEPFVGHMGE
jgi:hypothetical protein